MFKHLIKKVREESSNSSILPENSPDDTNGHSTRDTNDSVDPENITLARRSDSRTPVSSISEQPEKQEDKDESVKILADVLSPYIEDPITIHNCIPILISWIDSREEILQRRDDAVSRLTEESHYLQNDITVLRNRLAELHDSRGANAPESSTKASLSQKQIDVLRSDNENLKSKLRTLRTQLNEVEAERDDLLIKSTDVSLLKSTDDLQRQFDRQKMENQQQKSELDHYKQMLIERDMIIEQQDQRLLIDHDTQGTQTDEDTSFVQVLAEPHVDTISKLQAELDDKDRTIKILQQRYNDLRKTLQREFHASIPKDLHQLGSSKAASNTPTSPGNLPLIHYDKSGASQSDVDAAKRSSTARQLTAVRKNVTFTTPSSATVTPAILPHTTVDSSSMKSQRNGHRSSIDGQTATGNGTNFKYLKHVLLKFMTSTEEEAIHLIRAVSTLLNFSSDEERLLRETLDYKMSWFGKVSRLKPVTTSANA